MRTALVFMLLLFGTLNAHAGEAVTYAGKLGKLDIIVELTGPLATDRVVGRYAYRKKGIDIPLRGTLTGDSYSLIEEQSCTAKTCLDADGSPLTDPPVGADWTLTVLDGGKTLSGEWRGRDTGKTFAINLTRQGARALETSDDSLPDVLDPSYVSAGEDLAFLTPEELPYDFLKMDAPVTHGDEVAIGSGAYKMATDPRTGMSYPMVTRLAGADAGPVNAFLAQQRLQWNLYAFSCLSKTYLGNGYFGGIGDEPSTGMDGDGQVTVDYLTDRLMGITESGSYFCGGAHPFNFTIHRLVDVKTGEPVRPESLLKDWVAKDYDGKIVDPAQVDDPTTIMWSAGENLVKTVNATRKPLDAETERDCDIPALVGSNLGIYLKGDDLVFTLKDLEHVIFACTNDLMTVPIADAKDYLSPNALRYFSAFD